jgi:hypothetical protein
MILVNHPPINLDAIKYIRKRKSRCYELSGVLILDNPDWFLIHTVVNTPIGLNDHAYLEKDGVIYDPVANEFYDKEFIMKKYPPKKITVFNQLQAAQNVTQQKHWGPWDEKE